MVCSTIIRRFDSFLLKRRHTALSCNGLRNIWAAENGVISGYLEGYILSANK